MNDTNLNWNNDLLNSMSVASFLISIRNLQLNEKEISNSELEKHMQDQDKILQEQNEKYLKTIIEQNLEIINLLKGDNK